MSDSNTIIRADGKVGLKTITQSSMRSFRACPRRYFYSYVLGIRPIRTDEPLRFGTLWHLMREEWWKTLDLEHVLFMVPEPNEEFDEFVIAKLKAMLVGYHARYKDFAASIEVVAIEDKFAIPLVNPRTGRTSRLFEVRGMFDLVFREQGQLWIGEEKTAAAGLTPESPYWRRLEMDPQCSVYYDAATTKYKEAPYGVRYVVNVKTSKRPLKATTEIKMTKPTKKDPEPRPYAGQRLVDETSDEFYNRIIADISEKPDVYFRMVDVPRSDKDVFESKCDVWDTARAIHEAEKSGVWLRNPDACVHPFGSSCSYLPVCTGRASLYDTMQYRQTETQHEELA